MADGAGSNGDAAGLPVGKEAGEEPGAARRAAAGRGAAGERSGGAAGPLTRRLCPRPAPQWPA